MIGRQILNYRIVSSIGQGGMGEVFLAKHDKIDKTVAIKALLPSLLGNEMIRQRFINEAQSMSHLSHPKIVSLLDYHEDETGLYLIMEFVEGKPLDEIISKETGPMNEEAAVALMIQILEAFKYAHEKGLVHRDIKPSNIIVTPSKSVKVLDFGIAKIVGSGSNLTKTGTQMGTVYYMSPEQVKGSELDHRSDIYALGVTFYQMLTGTNPYSGITTEYEIYNQIVKEPLKSPKEVYPGVPEYLCKLVEKATAKDPADRYQSCSEMIEDLKSKSISKPSNKKPNTTAKKRNLLKPLFIAASILVLLGIGFAAYTFIDFSSGAKVTELKLFPIKMGNEWGYVDREGKLIITPQFKVATVFRDGLALVATGKEKLSYGYIDEDGKYVINAQYDEATVFSEGIAWVVRSDGKPTAIDKNGDELFTADSALAVHNFSEGLAPYKGITNKYGYYDKNGNIEISPKFIKACEFSDGVARVVVDNTNNSAKTDSSRSSIDTSLGEPQWVYRYVDKDGEFINSNQYEFATDFIKGKAIVRIKDKYGVINNSGAYLINPSYDKIVADGDLFLFMQENKYGWLDSEGKTKINAQFDNATVFGISEFAAVKSGEKWGYVNKEGKLVINPQFDLGLAFNGNMAPVYSNQKLGFVDVNGKYIVNPQFDEIETDYVLYTEGIERVVSFSNINGYGSDTASFLGIGFNPLWDEASADYWINKKVESDYFNAKEIVQGLNFNKPAQYNLNSTTFDDIKKKQPETEYFMRSGEIYLGNEATISNDVLYFVYANGSPYYTRSVQKQDYNYYWDVWEYYTVTEPAYDGKRKPTSYTYLVSLTEAKGKRKENILTELKNRFISEGYVEQGSGSYVLQSKAENRFVTIREKDYNDIQITFGLKSNS